MRSLRRRLPLVPIALAAAVAAGCGGAPTADLAQASRGAEPVSVLRARVRAAEGGTFREAAGRITVRVPPGALNADANLRVLLRDGPAAGPNQTVASAAFEVRFQSDDVALALAQPFTLEIAAAPAVHPQLGEIAAVEGGAWKRLPTSFYRPSTATVVSEARSIRGTYAAVHRSLQRESGPAVERGFQVFSYETFGNEAFFGGALGLHEVLNGVDPATAVALGAQVDLAKVPAAIVAVMTGTDFAAKQAALADPATTRALLRAGAVVGVKGVFADPTSDRMTSVGITCALCHQTVAKTAFELAPGVRVPLPIGPLESDGVMNAAMDAGKILSFTPGAVALGVEGVLAGWGPNRFDVRALNELDDGANDPTDTPPIWNFVDLAEQGYAFGWDGLFAGPNALASQAEAVYDVVMHGNGAFGTPLGNLPPALRPGATVRPAVLAALAAAEVGQPGNDLDTQKLLDLQSWMRSIVSPAPGPFDEAKAEAGWRLFNGKGMCNACHGSADLTGPAIVNVTGDLAGDLSGGVHVPSLRGVSRSAPYLHDDRLPDLPSAVEAITGLVAAATGEGFSAAEKDALVEYLKSL
jgi:cytochrome c2